MATDQDRALLETLTRLNATMTKFGMDLLGARLDQQAHIKLTLLLLDAADRVLKRLVDNRQHKDGGR